jgi:hypothetical protein
MPGDVVQRNRRTDEQMVTAQFQQLHLWNGGKVY